MVSLRDQSWDQCCLIFVSDIDSEIKCTLSKYANDIKLSGAVYTTHGRDAIQRDLDRLEKQDHANLWKLNKCKCKVAAPGSGQSQT